MNNTTIRIKALSGPTEQKSKKILENLSILATQICALRKWNVGSIEEFYPTTEGILGLNTNRGERIDIRLRNGNNEYLEWNDLVGTLCHELTHNEVWDHSTRFYEMMNSVHDQIEKLPNYEKIYAEMSGSSYNRGFHVFNKKSKCPISPETTTSQKLGNSAIITANGAYIQSGTLKGSLKEKMAQAALLRNNTTQICKPTKQSKPVSKEERRKLVLQSLQNRGIIVDA